MNFDHLKEKVEGICINEQEEADIYYTIQFKTGKDYREVLSRLIESLTYSLDAWNKYFGGEKGNN